MSFGEDLNDLVARSANGLHATHPSWERVQLGDIAHVVNGYPFKSSGFSPNEGTPVIRIRDVTSGAVSTFYRGVVDDPRMRFVNDGQIVIGMDGDFNCRLWEGGRALLNQRVCAVEADEEFYSQKFLAYALPGYLRLINDHTSSVTVKHLSSRTVQEIPLPLPPMPEQHRIVEKIESLFAQLDKGEESLRQVQTLLARYRQSVLKAAVTGELTADWRAQHAGQLEHGRDLLERILKARRENWQGRGKYKEPVEPDTSDLPELPEGWVWTSLDALITDGPTNGVSPRETTDPSGCLSFKLTATTSGKFIINSRTVKRVDFHPGEDSKYWLREGDVLIQRGNTIEYVGTAAVFPGPSNCYIYPDLMMRVRFSNQLLASWAVIWINFDYAKRHFRRLATGTAGNMPKINSTTLKSLAVPIPSEEEVRRILEVLNDFERSVDSAFQLTQSGFTRSSALRQSILKDAFSGKLVPQDPNDEPAAELLARIQASRAPAKKAPRRSRKAPEPA